MFKHYRDERRPEGRAYATGIVGFRYQTNQYPVICACDIVEWTVTSGGKPPVTLDRRQVTCPDCKERLVQ